MIIEVATAEPGREGIICPRKPENSSVFMDGREKESEADARAGGEAPDVDEGGKTECDGVEGGEDGPDSDKPVMTWIQCDKPMCRKWRRIETKIAESIGDDDKW